MGKSKSFNELGRRLESRGDELVNSVENLVRNATNAALTSAAIGTPIDLGQAKNNWFVAGGTPDLDSVIPSDENIGNMESQVVSRAEAAIDSWRVGKGSLFITNNLHYIIALDDGHSRQAPEGMSRQALNAARQVLRKHGPLFKDTGNAK